jgi:hypothetical protein
VKEQRWPWLLTAAMMLAAAVAAAWSTYLHWLPCQGSMLDGTIIHHTVGDGRSYEEFQRLDPAVKARMLACEGRMDTSFYEPGEQTPWAPELFVLAMALAGLAWLMLVLGLRWQLRTKVVAALPGLASLATAVVGAVAIGDAVPPPDNPVLGMLLLIIEWSALVALVAILAWQPEVRGRRRFLRLVVALWGTTAFGGYHGMLESMIMIVFSDRDWDTPPGTRYLTVAAITICAILIVIMTLRMPQSGADNEPHPDQQLGSLTLA